MTSIPRRPASAISGPLVDPVSTVTISDRPSRLRGLDRAQAQPVPFVETARDIRLGVDAEPSERPDHDRQAGQPVGIEVAEDEHPLAGLARPLHPGHEAGGVGQQRGVVETLAARRNERRQGVDVGDPTPTRSAAIRSEKPAALAAARKSGVGSTGSGRCQRKRGSITPSGCHDSLHPGLSRGSDQEAERRAGRLAAASWARFRSSRLCQTTRSGAALKIEEYVPGHDPDEQGEDEVVRRRAAEQEQRRQGQDDGQARVDRASRRSAGSSG